MKILLVLLVFSSLNHAFAVDWDISLQEAHSALIQNANNNDARKKGAEALVQKGLPISAEFFQPKDKSTTNDKIPTATLAEQASVPWKKVWSLLQAKDFANAKEVANLLVDDTDSIYSLRTYPILAYLHLKAAESKQIDSLSEKFNSLYDKALSELDVFKNRPLNGKPPSIFKGRFEIAKNQIDEVTSELERIKRQNSEKFPVYAFLAEKMAAKKEKMEKTATDHILDAIGKYRSALTLAKVQMDKVLSESYFRSNQIDVIEKGLALTEKDSALQDTSAGLYKRSAILISLSQLYSKKEDWENSQRSKRRALTLLDKALSQEKTFNGRNKTLYLKGKLQYDFSQKEEAQKTLETFLKDFPKDPLASESHLILGDIYFDKGNYKKASEHFTFLTTEEKSKWKSYALYKLGWTLYSQNKNQEALSYLEKAIQSTEAWEKTDFQKSLEKEARKDMIAIYAESGDLAKAPAHFTEILKEESSGSLLELAKKLESEGQFEKAADIYHSLASQAKTETEGISYYNAILVGAQKLKQWARFESEAEQMVTRYSGHLPAESETIFRESLKNFVDTYRADKKTLRLKLFETYFAGFSGSENAEEPLFTHTEWMTKEATPEAAAELWRTYWTKFGEKSTTADRKEYALRQWIKCLEQTEKKIEPTPNHLSGVAVEIMRLAEEYQLLFPSAKYTRPVSYLASSLLYKYQMIDKAMASSQKLFDMNPRDEFGQKAFEDLRTSYYQQKAWEKAFHWAQELWTRQFPGMDSYKKSLSKIREESLFLWAEGDPNDLAAADRFILITNQPELQSIWEKSFYNAYARLLNAGKKDKALLAIDLLEKNFPRSEYLSKTASTRAALFQESGAYAKAYGPLILAIQSNQYAKKPDELASALLNAGLMAEGLGKTEDAKTLLLKYMAEFPRKNPESLEIAARTLQRVSGKGDRQISSAPQGFQLILNEAEKFENAPIAKKGNLAARIKDGGSRLETLVKKLMEVSAQISVYPDIAAEASCLIPSLFTRYQKAVDEIANDLPESSRAQIQNLSMTLQGKSKELGIQCLKNSQIAEHDGPRFREVNQKWGWEWDPILSNKTTQFIQFLEDKWQPLDGVSEVKTEEELYQQHLQGKGSADSWYQLAKLRFAQNQFPLCRLTLIDALSKYPYSGKLINAYAILDSIENPESKRGVTLLKAAKFGSTQAMVNLSIYHLKGGRLSKGLDALREAYEAGLLDRDKELKEASKEWVKK